jgi:hypothetical protein
MTLRLPREEGNAPVQPAAAPNTAFVAGFEPGPGYVVYSLTKDLCFNGVKFKSLRIQTKNFH